jgi:hypothetical protein
MKSGTPPLLPAGSGQTMVNGPFPDPRPSTHLPRSPQAACRTPDRRAAHSALGFATRDAVPSCQGPRPARSPFTHCPRARQAPLPLTLTDRTLTNSCQRPNFHRRTPYPCPLRSPALLQSAPSELRSLYLRQRRWGCRAASAWPAPRGQRPWRRRARQLAPLGVRRRERPLAANLLVRGPDLPPAAGWERRSS